MSLVEAGKPQVEYADDGRRIYEPDGRVLARFMMDRSGLAIIRGPWGSGTSSACCQRIFQHAIEQNVGSDGMRRSRWFCMRESYPKVETTLLETWKYWFPEARYGKLYTGAKPYRHEIRVGNIVLDVYFGAVDDLAGDSPFVSLEPTGWWWNELEYVSMSAFFSAHGRVGRFPPVIEGGSKWSGTIADLNAPPENHWLPMMTGEVDLPDDMSLDDRQRYTRPPGLAYFVQPPAVFAEKGSDGRIKGWEINQGQRPGTSRAENLRWLRDPNDDDGQPGEAYYRRAMIGKTSAWIRKNLANEILPMVEGEAVWTSYDADVHLSKDPLEPIPDKGMSIGLDFGRRPAAVFCQRIGGQKQVQFELTMTNAGASKMAPAVRAMLAQHYPWVIKPNSLVDVRAWGDPKGQDGTQTDERNAYDIFRAHGIIVRPAPVKQNNIRTRVEAVEYQLDRMTNGRPALLISPRCARLKMAMAGGYRYPKERPSPVEERKPVKDQYSDIADALQYETLGEGGGNELIGRSATNRPGPVATRQPGHSLRRIGRGR